MRGKHNIGGYSEIIHVRVWVVQMTNTKVLSDTCMKAHTKKTLFPKS